MDMIFTIADHLMKTSFASLPKETVERTKLLILDSLGVAMAGAGTPSVREVVELMAELGGKPESTVLYFGGKLNAMDAAFVNSMMIHALDMDDCHEECLVHVSCCQIPVAFSLAEKCPPVHGKDLITAIALGMDIVCRLAFGIISGMGFVRSGICGIFGAVATAAKLRRCTREQIVNAMGIAFSQTAGNTQVLLDGALVKRMQPGFMVRDGMFSVLLAERGVKGPENVIEGKYGFLELYKRGDIFPERITRDLGKVYEGSNSSVKPYPGGRFTHGPAALAIEMSRKYNLEPEQISEMIIYLPRTAHGYVGSPYNPNLNLGNPQVMAQFCAPYAAAAGIVRGDFFIGELEENVIKDPKIGALARRTKAVVDETVKDPTATSPVSLEIRMKDGRTFSQKLTYLKGHPKNYLSKEEFVSKFKKCLKFCPTQIQEDKVEKVIDLVENLEDVSDVGNLFKLLVKENSK